MHWLFYYKFIHFSQYNFTSKSKIIHIVIFQEFSICTNKNFVILMTIE